MTAPAIYHASPFNREFIGYGVADQDPMDPENYLIPAHAYLDAPGDFEPGYAYKRSDDGLSWVKVEDHRGMVYSVSDGSIIEFLELGPLPQNLTSTPKPEGFYIWSGDEWVFDEGSHSMSILLQNSSALRERTLLASQQKSSLSNRIGTLEDAIELEEATEAERAELPVRRAQLLEWKRYAIYLGRVTTQAGWHMSVEWPAQPADGMDLSVSAIAPDSPQPQ